MRRPAVKGPRTPLRGGTPDAEVFDGSFEGHRGVVDKKEDNCNMLQVVYASAATKPFTRGDLVELLKVARSRNMVADISGMLLYHSGSFLQVLEGPEKDVEELYARILRDPRHNKCVLVLRESIQKKEFENWSMGFVDTTKVGERIEGFVDYATQLKTMTLDKTGARKILSRFQSGEWRRSKSGCF
jgi:hypothetical protein